MTPRPAILLGLLGLWAAPLPVHAQTFDRSRPPELGPPPTFRAPAVATATLANGIRLYVVEMHEVPLVHVGVTVAGGSRLDGDLPGLATFTAGMLDEGAGSRDANAIAAEAAYLGASLGTGADWDGISATLRVPRRTLDPAFDLLADVLLRPTFATAEVARQRDLRIAQILQQRDQPAAVAFLAFGKQVFPSNHPYHHPANGDSASTAALDSVMVRDFYARTVRPDRTSIVITGDITLAEARDAVTRRFGSWSATGAAAQPRAVGNPARQPTRVVLVDKPGAAQSVILIGGPGIERSDPDYYALMVMNTILGGSFSSRLNTTLRETKGYTYGARSAFLWRPLPGPYLAQAAVRTNVTDSSLVEFFREFALIRDTPVSATELERGKAYLALGLAGDFETTRQVAAQLETLLTFGLPLDWHNTMVERVMAVTADDVQRVARRMVRPDEVTVVIVGDVAAVRDGVERLGLGPVSVVEP